MVYCSFLLPDFIGTGTPKKNQKKAQTNDYIPFAGWFPDLAFVLLWLQHLQFIPYFQNRLLLLVFEFCKYSKLLGY